MKSYDSALALGTQLSDLDMVYRPKINVPYTTIVGRAQIPDLANDLSIRGPVERIIVQNVIEVPGESGPNGEKVFSAQGDRDGVIRFIGATSATSDAYGQYLNVQVGTIIEVTFYGTGLNGLFLSGSGYTALVSVDGGAYGSNVLPTTSTILQGRNYNTNNLINLASGLTAGIHTVSIKNAGGGSVFYWYGFEILNESTTLNSRPGTYLAKSKMMTKTVASTLPFKPDAYVSGGYTRGACVVNYLNADGTQGQVFTPVNASAAFLTAADHTNEELIRTYMPREFGAGRTPATPDDFSQGTSATARLFTLDDGTTTLTGFSIQFYNNESIKPSSTNGYFWTFTFVGSGIDLLGFCDASTGTDLFAYSIDGGTLTNFIGTGQAYSQTTATRHFKIASGLPYGTHTLRIQRNTAANAFDFYTIAMKVYAPKTPTIPGSAKELSKHYVMADYVVGSAGVDKVAQGVLRKIIAAREASYVGTWSYFSPLNPGTFVGGNFAYTTTTGNYVEYTFFGTGFEFKGWAGSNRSLNVTVAVDGGTVAGSAYGGFSYSAPTLNMTAGTVEGSGFAVTGLTLGKHTVRFTMSGTPSTYGLTVEGIDIICPIHFPKIQTDGMRQNTLSVGSCSLNDSRKTWLQSVEKNKVRATALGVTAGASTSATAAVPMPDMSVTVNSSGGDFFATYSVTVYTTAINVGVYLIMYVDGVALSPVKYALGSNLNQPWMDMSDFRTFYLSAGIHKIDVYWYVDGATAVLLGGYRNLTVIEL